MKRRDRRKYLIGVLVALSCVVLNTGLAGERAAANSPVPGAAQSTSNGDLASWTPFLKAQIPVDEAAQRIVKAGGAGFTSVSISVPERTVAVYWKGEVPAAVTQVMKQIRRSGIQVVIHAANYSHIEQVARARNIMAAQNRYLAQGAEIVGIVLPGDGGGLHVKIHRTSAAPTMLRLQTQATSDFGSEVKVVDGIAARPTDRLLDAAPHWAGARMVNTANLEYCTSGFPVTRNGSQYILTARHCGSYDWWAKKSPDFTSQYSQYEFGRTSSYIDTSDDAELVNATVLGPLQGYTYDGGVSAGTDFSDPIAGAATLNIGGLSVCQSGSSTGVHCGLVVANYQEWDAVGNSGFSALENPISGTSSTCSGLAWGTGDSGGPLFTLASGSWRTARGIMSIGYGTGFPCQNSLGEHLTGYKVGGGIDFTRILSDFGAQVVTG